MAGDSIHWPSPKELIMFANIQLKGSLFNCRIQLLISPNPLEEDIEIQYDKLRGRDNRHVNNT